MTFDLVSVRGRLPGRRIDWFESLDSTMTEAARDPEPGRIVGAEEQTAGVGRLGRSWHSPAGEGLYVSMVLPGGPAPIMMLGLGLAVWNMLSRLLLEHRLKACVTVDLRWPNDVLLSQRKVAGILAVANGDLKIAGIGVNVSQRRFPPDLDTPATSLALEGVFVAREELLVGLVASIDQVLALPPAEIRDRFTRASTYAQGRRVRASDIEGVTCGLDPSGFLQVREDNGTVHTILAGGVRPA